MIPRYMPKLIVIAFAVLTVGIIGYEVMIQQSVSGEEGNHYIVELQDGIVITSSITTEQPHYLIGTTVFSDDMTTCWEIEEKIGVLYYKISGDCENA